MYNSCWRRWQKIKNLLTLNDWNIFYNFLQGSIKKQEVTCNSRYLFVYRLPLRLRSGKKSLDSCPADKLPGTWYCSRARHKRCNWSVHKRTERRTQHHPWISATLLLDFGIWVSLQSVVECRHCNRRWDADVLARTVNEGFDNLPVEMITNVFDHLSILWELMLRGGSENLKMEERRACHNNLPQLEWFPTSLQNDKKDKIFGLYCSSFSASTMRERDSFTNLTGAL